MQPQPPPLKLIVRAAALALCAGLAAVAVLGGPRDGVLGWLELLAIIVLAVVLLAAVASFAAGRLADWREPASEEEFELLVERSERLARDGLAVEPGEEEFLELDPRSDGDFEELVRDALDELPDLLQNALAHVAVVISDGGRRRHAYGLYHGDGGRRDEHPDRIVIYRDTLRRDFGHDADALREQVIRTVRHELAHHVGFDEMGVRGLGL
ncbi:MAG: hypothetical protein NVSMB51_05260 [Solirubrobacteraceae bacterium]